ncbi:unnamed protein product [Arctogadus glacialis]
MCGVPQGVSITVGLLTSSDVPAQTKLVTQPEEGGDTPGHASTGESRSRSRRRTLAPGEHRCTTPPQ